MLPFNGSILSALAVGWRCYLCATQGPAERDLLHGSVGLGVIVMRSLFSSCKFPLDVEGLSLRMIKHQLSHNDLRLMQDGDLERPVCS